MKIVIIESYPIFRAALVDLLGRFGFEVVGEGVNATEALALTVQHRPGIVLIDHVFTNIPELAALTRVVVYAGITAVEPAVIALDRGASGYILKTADDLVQGLRMVAAGNAYITNGFSAKVITAFKDETTRKNAVAAINLSAREMQIVRLLMLGQTNKQIATNMVVSEKTVKHYMTILLQKLNARNRLEAVIAVQKMETARP